MTEYDSAAKLAAHAGLAPITRDSGTVSGNHHGPRRYHRVLRNTARHQPARGPHSAAC